MVILFLYTLFVTSKRKQKESFYFDKQTQAMKTDTNKRVKTPPRTQAKKNVLDYLYRRCDKDKSYLFRNHLKECNIPYNTFISDTKTDITKIDVYRYFVYCEFFGYENLPNYQEMKTQLDTQKNDTKRTTDY